MKIKFMLLFILVLSFISCADLHERWCSACAREKEINEYKMTLNQDQINTYNECKKQYLGDALVKCEVGYYSDAVTKRCVNDFIFAICSGEY